MDYSCQYFYVHTVQWAGHCIQSLYHKKYQTISVQCKVTIAHGYDFVQKEVGRRFGTSKMHLSPPVAWAAVRSKAVVLLLTFCLLLLPLWESVIVLCFVVCSFMSILVLQSS